jgi:hypothetical protein
METREDFYTKGVDCVASCNTTIKPQLRRTLVPL